MFSHITIARYAENGGEKVGTNKAFLEIEHDDDPDCKYLCPNCGEEIKNKIVPWKIIFTANDLSFNIVECPDCRNRCLCCAAVDYVFCPYCGNRRIGDVKEN